MDRGELHEQPERCVSAALQGEAAEEKHARCVRHWQHAGRQKHVSGNTT